MRRLLRRSLLTLSALFAGTRPDRRGLIERDFISGEWMVPEGIDEEKTANLKLDQLDYVIFDTETTGLRPQAGDEIISIAAVRMTGGEIDEENIFSRLVDPGRKIPRRSTRVHGITDAMVAGAPDIASVLREFREFIADDVLVAHHAAFDMSFLRMKEAVIGEALGNIVLDTLLLSMFLDRFSHDHSLEGLAERAGVTIHGRHSALGDAMATARVFRKLLSRLQTQGVVTLRHALDGSREIADLQKNRSL